MNIDGIFRQCGCNLRVWIEILIHLLRNVAFYFLCLSLNCFGFWIMRIAFASENEVSNGKECRSTVTLFGNGVINNFFENVKWTLVNVYNNRWKDPVADLGDVWNTYPLSVQLFFNFIQFPGNNGQSNRFVPPSLQLAAPLGNHGSATAILSVSTDEKPCVQYNQRLLETLGMNDDKRFRETWDEWWKTFMKWMTGNFRSWNVRDASTHRLLCIVAESHCHV